MIEKMNYCDLLTYELLDEKLAQFIDNEHFRLNLCPKKNYYSEDNFYIGVQLRGNCDVEQQIDIYNYKNRMHVTKSCDEKSQLKAQPFTVGDFIKCLELSELDELIKRFEI